MAQRRGPVEMGHVDARPCAPRGQLKVEIHAYGPKTMLAWAHYIGASTSWSSCSGMAADRIETTLSWVSSAATAQTFGVIGVQIRFHAAAMRAIYLHVILRLNQSR
jgi:hypothetical protein